MSLSSPYYNLRNAVRHRPGGICTAHEVRRELQAYLDWMAPKERAWGKKFWAEIMTREEYHALANRRKKRKGKKRVDGELVFTYNSVEGKQVTAHSDTGLTEVHDADLEWIGEWFRKQNENEYNGEW